MAVRSNDWLRLHSLLRDPLGEEAANKLMEFLPPVPWTELATKQDLSVLESRLRTELHDALRRQTMWLASLMMPTLLAGMGLVAAIG